MIDSKLGGIWVNFLLLLFYGFLIGCFVVVVFFVVGFDDFVCMGCGFVGLFFIYLFVLCEVFGV